jgi:hypothetical protein
MANGSFGLAGVPITKGNILGGVIGSAVRVAPPEWRQAKLITDNTSSEVVPQNVFQMLVCVFGAGGSGGANNGGQTTGGGGGGFSMGIIDVTPGQLLPAITIGVGGATSSFVSNGASGGTSSFGTLLSATGGGGGLQQIGTNAAIVGGSGGVGIVSASVRQGYQLSSGGGGGGERPRW